MLKMWFERGDALVREVTCVASVVRLAVESAAVLVLHADHVINR